MGDDERNGENEIGECALRGLRAGSSNESGGETRWGGSKVERVVTVDQLEKKPSGSLETEFRVGLPRCCFAGGECLEFQCRD